MDCFYGLFVAVPGLEGSALLSNLQPLIKSYMKHQDNLTALHRCEQSGRCHLFRSCLLRINFYWWRHIQSFQHVNCNRTTLCGPAFLFATLGSIATLHVYSQKGRSFLSHRCHI